MKAYRPSRFRVALWCLPALALTGCPVEERTLEFGYAVGSKTGHGEAGSKAGERAEDGGSSGAADSANAGDAALPGGGVSAASGGSLGVQAGEATGATSGRSTAGGASSGNGNGGAGGTVTSAGTGGSAGNSDTAGGGGSAGNPDAGLCGDINLNGVEDCDETLVTNANFDQRASEWEAEASINQSWSSSDARGKANSGSVVITSVKQGPPEGWGLAGTGQCVSATGGDVFEIGARAQIPAGQAEGRATISLAIFGNDGCKGTFLSAATPALLAASGEWHVLRGTAKMPPATRSFYVRLAAEKPNAQPSLEVHFDDVLVRQK